MGWSFRYLNITLIFYIYLALGGYTAVNIRVGNKIDFYNIQYYNQGPCYTDFYGLFEISCAIFPRTAVFELKDMSNIPAHKIVVGKPLERDLAPAGGYVSAENLSKIFTAASNYINPQVMGWKWIDQSFCTKWLHTVIQFSAEI